MGYKIYKGFQENGMEWKVGSFRLLAIYFFSYFEKTSAYEYHTQPNSPYRVLQILVV